MIVSRNGSLVESIFHEVAQADDLEEQLAILLRGTLDVSGAALGLAARFDPTSRALEILAVEGGSGFAVGRIVCPTDPAWASLTSDGMVRQGLTGPGCVAGANLFVPTLDPDVQRAVVHLEWRREEDLRAGMLEELLAACRRVRNLVGLADKAWEYERLRAGPPAPMEPAPDFDLDEPMLEILLKKATDRVARLARSGQAAIFIVNDGGDLDFRATAYQGDLLPDPRSLPRVIRRRAPKGHRGPERRACRGAASGLAFAALDARKTYLAGDLARDVHHTPLFRDTVSGVAVPVFLAGRPLAVILAESASPSILEEEPIRRLEEFSREFAIHVVKSIIYEKSKRSRPEDPVVLVGVPRQVIEAAVSAAGAKAILLVHGERGTGKEMLVRFVHEVGPRRERPFLVLNCAAVHESLIEDELFGHLKGAFTGAHANKQGIFVKAKDGTVFVDEIHHLPKHLQVKLLRVLEKGVVSPVGSSGDEVSVNARVIVGTNRELRGLVKDGQFESDLYDRVNVWPLRMPSLRENPSVIPRVAEVLLRGLAERNRKPVPVLAPAALRVLREFPYPGNVRELRNGLECALMADRDGEIGLEDLPAVVVEASPLRSEEPGKSLLESPRAGDGDPEEKRNLIRALKERHGNVAGAARDLGMSRRQMYRLIQKYGIEPEDHRP